MARDLDSQPRPALLEIGDDPTGGSNRPAAAVAPPPQPQLPQSPLAPSAQSAGQGERYSHGSMLLELGEGDRTAQEPPGLEAVASAPEEEAQVPLPDSALALDRAFSSLPDFDGAARTSANEADIESPVPRAPTRPAAKQRAYVWLALAFSLATISLLVSVFVLLGEGSRPLPPAAVNRVMAVASAPERVRKSQQLVAPQPRSKLDPDQSKVETLDEERKLQRRALIELIDASKHDRAVIAGLAHEQQFQFDWELHTRLAHAARKAGRVTTAIRWFSEFVERYPATNYVHDAAFWVAQLRMKAYGLNATVEYLESIASDDTQGWRGAADTQLQRLLRLEIK
ncbi:MAG: hypothetical protein AAFQ82_12585 [Myxococcota bacterium]